MARAALTDPVVLAGHRAPSRVLFGPHETNLGQGRSISARHVAYYARRSAGGAGVLVTETASVHDSDWPYERAPLAQRRTEKRKMLDVMFQAAGSAAWESSGPLASSRIRSAFLFMRRRIVRRLVAPNATPRARGMPLRRARKAREARKSKCN